MKKILAVLMLAVVLVGATFAGMPKALRMVIEKATVIGATPCIWRNTEYICVFVKNSKDTYVLVGVRTKEGLGVAYVLDATGDKPEEIWRFNDVSS